MALNCSPKSILFFLKACYFYKRAEGINLIRQTFLLFPLHLPTVHHIIHHLYQLLKRVNPAAAQRLEYALHPEPLILDQTNLQNWAWLFPTHTDTFRFIELLQDTTQHKLYINRALKDLCAIYEQCYTPPIPSKNLNNN